jgi:hypothetical protein
LEVALLDSPEDPLIAYPISKDAIEFAHSIFSRHNRIRFNFDIPFIFSQLYFISFHNRFDFLIDRYSISSSRKKKTPARIFKIIS